MGLIFFDNVTYKENAGTTTSQTHLKNVTLTITENMVTSFLGDALSGISYLGGLINATLKPYTGKVKIMNYINDGKRIKNINKLRMKVGVVSLFPSEMLFNKKVSDELKFGVKYFKYKIDKSVVRVKDALKLVGLSEDVLNKRVSDLTLNEQRKVSLSSVLIFNPSIIVLNNPTYSLSEKDKQDLIKLLRMLKEKYKKTIIILTKDTNFAYQISDEVFIFNKSKLVSHGTKKLLEDESILNANNLETPKILDFINKSNKKNAHLTNTSNILDLIKEVYRNAR